MDQPHAIEGGACRQRGKERQHAVGHCVGENASATIGETAHLAVHPSHCCHGLEQPEQCERHGAWKNGDDVCHCLLAEQRHRRQHETDIREVRYLFDQRVLQTDGRTEVLRVGCSRRDTDKDGPVAQPGDLPDGEAGDQGDHAYLDCVEVPDLDDRQERLPRNPERPFDLRVYRQSAEAGQRLEDQEYANPADQSVHDRFVDEIEHATEWTYQHEKHLNEPGKQDQCQCIADVVGTKLRRDWQQRNPDRRRHGGVWPTAEHARRVEQGREQHTPDCGVDAKVRWKASQRGRESNRLRQRHHRQRDADEQVAA